MNTKISAFAMVLLILATILPVSATIQATNVEIRGTVAQNENIKTGMMLSDNASWNAYNFAGFYYNLKNDIGTENLSITSGDLVGNGRIIQENHLTYMTQGQPEKLYVVQNGVSDGLVGFDEGQMSGVAGSYNIVGWQAQPYVGIKGHSNKLAKLLIEQGNSSSEKKTMKTGETWDVGGGWTLKANAIDAKASPRQLWFTLSKDGVKKDDSVIQQGKIYTYVEKSIGGESDVPLFVTYVDSVFSGSTSDMVQFRYTWAIDTSITELKGGEKYGVFKVQGIDPIILQNTDSSITLNRDTTVSLMGELKFRVADDSVLRFYPIVEYQIVLPTSIPTVSPTASPVPVVTIVDTPVPIVVSPTQTVAPVVQETVKNIVTPTPQITSKKSPGFSGIFAIAGLLTVAYLVLRQRK